MPIVQHITTHAEISALEKPLRQAELGPDPEFFDEVFRDDTVFMSEGQVSLREGPGPRRTPAHKGEVHRRTGAEHADRRAWADGDRHLRGAFSTPDHTNTLEFMRVWMKENGRWQVVAVTISRYKGREGAAEAYEAS